MDKNIDLSSLRSELDDIDAKILSLFLERMALSAQIAAYKKKHSLPVTDAGRELEVLERVERNAPGYERYARELFIKLIELSKELQTELS